MLNAGCFFAVAIWICALLRSGNARPTVAAERPHLTLAALLAIAITVAAFWPTLWNPFQFDAFTHLFEVRNASLTQMLARFHRERLFFRPVGFLFYWIEARGAGLDLLRWHLTNIALHALNGLVLYLVLFRLGFQRLLSAFGAIAFLTSGVTAEAVAWIDAPFDLLATLFVLLAMLELLNWTRSGLPAHLAACSGLVLIACFTKESAFCAPLLALALGLTRSDQQRKRAWIAASSIGACCCAGFGYRLWALHGIGGYPGLSGSELLHVPHLLLLRLWGILQFPINWSTGVSVVLFILYCLSGAALLYTAVLGHARRSILAAGLTWAAAAILPALPVALISSDLSGARVYYLASAGVAVALASAVEGLRRRPMQVAVAIAIVGCNVAILEHNLAPWFRVSSQAADACRAFGAIVNRSAGTFEVLDLPAKRDGVYFLSNGFPECVALYSGADPAHIQASGSERWRWNDRENRFERLE